MFYVSNLFLLFCQSFNEINLDAFVGMYVLFFTEYNIISQMNINVHLFFLLFNF